MNFLIPLLIVCFHSAGLLLLINQLETTSVLIVIIAWLIDFFVQKCKEVLASSFLNANTSLSFHHFLLSRWFFSLINNIIRLNVKNSDQRKAASCDIWENKSRERLSFIKRHTKYFTRQNIQGTSDTGCFSGCRDISVGVNFNLLSVHCYRLNVHCATELRMELKKIVLRICVGRQTEDSKWARGQNKTRLETWGSYTCRHLACNTWQLSLSNHAAVSRMLAPPASHMHSWMQHLPACSLKFIQSYSQKCRKSQTETS